MIHFMGSQGEFSRSVVTTSGRDIQGFVAQWRERKTLTFGHSERMRQDTPTYGIVEELDVAMAIEDSWRRGRRQDR